MPGSTLLPLINDAYLIDPFVATPIDYQSVRLTWKGPDPTTNTPMTGFRLLANRYGFPVDENDGTILMDTTSLPGQQFVDQSAVPGALTYYGFYINGQETFDEAGVLTPGPDVWIRAGFTACLLPVNHGYGAKLLSWLPDYFQAWDDSELTTDNAGNPFLIQFLDVAGWSLDYLKTQYDFLFDNQNDAIKMSFSDLSALAGQLGVPFPAEIPAYFARKAVENWATVMRERGSLQGITDHLSLLSGFGADIQLSRNIMLENDQSLPLSPVFPPFDASKPYKVGEIVSWPVYPEWVVSQPYVVNNFVVYNGVNYQCIAVNGQGIPPTGALTSGTFWTIASGPFLYQCKVAITSLPAAPPPAAPSAGLTPNPSDTNWQLFYDTDATQSHLVIPGLVGGLNTWEVLTATTGSTTPNLAAPAAGSLVEGLGIHNPSSFNNDFSQNTIRVYNKSGSTKDSWLRSVSRQAADITNGLTVPDPQLVVEHGIPVPQTSLEVSEWNATTRYGTGSVVLFSGRNYLALRASTGETPPSSGSTTEWQPLGTDSRIPLMISAQTSQNWSEATVEQFAITPFVEWYDNWGNLITRVFSRTLSNYTYDSFAASFGTVLLGKETDTADQAWTVPEGGWKLDGHGNAYPSTSGTDSIALVVAASSATQAVTFSESPQTGKDTGLVFWYQSSTQYWHAGMQGLWYNNAGTWTELATYATPFEPGDRIYVVTNRVTPAITIFRNSLSTPVTYSGTPGTIPGGMVPSSGATVHSGIASEAI